MHKWGTGCDTRSLVIFEGEGDAASYYQLTGGKYPVVSVPTGAKGSLAVLKNHYEWLDRFDKLVLHFDGAEPGRDWSRKAEPGPPPGKGTSGEIQGPKAAHRSRMGGAGKAI